MGITVKFAGIWVSLSLSRVRNKTHTAHRHNFPLYNDCQQKPCGDQCQHQTTTTSPATPRRCAPKTQCPIFTNPRLAYVPFELSLDIPSWTVLANEICAMHTSIGTVVAINDCTANICGIFPDKLCEMPGRCAEFPFRVIIFLFFVCPCIDREGGVFEVGGEILSVRSSGVFPYAAFCIVFGIVGKCIVPSHGICLVVRAVIVGTIQDL